MEQQVTESSTSLEALENESARVLPNFQVNRDIIENVAIENQSEELRCLNITVYDQSKFEEGILRQVDDALEEQERQKKAIVKKKSKNEKKGKSIITDDKVQEETEKEKLVRLGQMTPFGTVLGEKNTELTSFEKYLLEQEKLRNEKAKLTSKKGKALKSSTVQAPAVPQKQLTKKEIHRKEGLKRSEKISRKDKNSDSDYVPSDIESPKPKLVNIPKKRRKKESERDWNTDDSDWEYSDNEDVPKKRKSKKTDQVIDDGNKNDYNERLAELTDFALEHQDCEEFEGGYRIPLSIWNQLYNYQKVAYLFLLPNGIYFLQHFILVVGWRTMDVRTENSALWWNSR